MGLSDPPQRQSPPHHQLPGPHSNYGPGGLQHLIWLPERNPVRTRPARSPTTGRTPLLCQNNLARATSAWSLEEAVVHARRDTSSQVILPIPSCIVHSGGKDFVD